MPSAVADRATPSAGANRAAPSAGIVRRCEAPSRSPPRRAPDMAAERMRVLYISGWQRSGSTILANILGQLDGFVSTGELYYLWDYVWERNIRCGCGSGFHDCPLWKKVVDDAFGSADRVDVDGMRRMALLACSTRRLPRLMIPWTRRRLANRLGEYVVNLRRLYAS